MSYIKKFCHSLFMDKPNGFYIILYTEICELFGRFGITALLVLYISNQLKLSDSTAFAIYGAFTALIYIMPLLGGYYSDKFMGAKQAILLGIAIMALGNLTLSIPNTHSLFIGLALVAIGMGYFNPTLTALLGKIYQGREDGRDAAFVMYYIAKNIGALFATILCGIVGQRYGYNYAFLLSAFAILTGFFVFYYGHRRLNVSIELKSIKNRKPLTASLTLLLIPTISFILAYNLGGYILLLASIITLGVIFGIKKRVDLNGRRHINIILLAILLVIIFSVFLGQGGTTLNLFIDRMINRQVFNIEIPTPVFYSLDPFFMILLGPLVIALVDKITRPNYISATFKKFALGLAFLGLGFLVFVFASKVALHQVKPSILYVVIAYAIFPVAELCIMPIAISLITHIAPKGHEALFVGIYMLGLGIASYLTGVFSNLGRIPFTIDTPEHFHQAAGIYQHTFFTTGSTLIIAALLLATLRYIFKRHLN